MITAISMLNKGTRVMVSIDDGVSMANETVYIYIYIKCYRNTVTIKVTAYIPNVTSWRKLYGTGAHILHTRQSSGWGGPTVFVIFISHK